MAITERMALSPMEAASTLGLCLNSIYKMLKRGQIQGVRVDRKILIPRTELERLLHPGIPTTLVPPVVSEK
jgi:excisionase family DNA binding protein